MFFFKNVKLDFNIVKCYDALRKVLAFVWVNEVTSMWIMNFQIVVLLLLAPILGVVQYFICKAKNKKMALMIPVLWFVMSLMLVFGSSRSYGFNMMGGMRSNQYGFRTSTHHNAFVSAPECHDQFVSTGSLRDLNMGYGNMNRSRYNNGMMHRNQGFYGFFSVVFNLAILNIPTLIYALMYMSIKDDKDRYDHNEYKTELEIKEMNVHDL